MLTNQPKINYTVFRVAMLILGGTAALMSAYNHWLIRSYVLSESDASNNKYEIPVNLTKSSDFENEVTGLNPASYTDVFSVISVPNPVILTNEQPIQAPEPLPVIEVKIPEPYTDDMTSDEFNEWAEGYQESLKDYRKATLEFEVN